LSPSTKRITAIASCFRGAKYLPAFLESCARQTIADETEVLLVHNEPTDDELAIVAAFVDRHPGLVAHLVVPRESLAVSTNRALVAARGEYVAIWNVDDLRTPDSLEACARTLDRCPEAAFTYGDYLLVDRWQATDGPRVTPPEFERREFTRSMHLGPFYMWRRSLCEEIGYWDEQLRMGADFDYAIRLALAGDGVRTDALLGYYLDEGLGLSTAATSVQPIEAAALILRYGALDKLDLAYYGPARRYRLDDIRRGDEWIPLDRLAPDHQRYARGRWWLAVAALRSLATVPFHLRRSTRRAPARPARQAGA
jgi:glycosyltransferase involved in cell wall biosynthesis